MPRIIFNGQEYPGGEAMPDDIRQAYDDALAMLRKAHPEVGVLGPDTPGYRRFVRWSAAGLATAAVLLLGVAWYLP